MHVHRAYPERRIGFETRPERGYPETAVFIFPVARLDFGLRQDAG
jgi:hypothetical protein